MSQEASRPADGTSIVIGIGPGVWEDMDEDIPLVGQVERLALLPEGTIGGNPTVEILIRLSDGRLVHANTTWRLWEAATNAFAADDSTWIDGLREPRRPL